MKKIIALLLALSMILVFVGCGDDSDKIESAQNQATLTPPTENNSTVNQGTPTTPPTNNGTVDQGTAIPPATSGYPFEKGSVTDYVYTNTWANLKFDMMENGSWTEVDASTSTDPNIIYGFVTRNVALETIVIGFEEITNETANMTEYDYLEKYMSMLKESGETDSYDFSEVYDCTIANAAYKSLNATYLDAIINLNVRKLDNYFVIIIVNSSADELSNILGGIKTAR